MKDNEGNDIDYSQCKPVSCYDDNKPGFLVVEVKDFKDWFRFIEELRSCGQLSRWVFRGQKNADWNVCSTFDRMFPFDEVLPCKQVYMSGLNSSKRSHAEELLVKFEQSGVKLFKILLEDKHSSIFDLLALMQHYGAPTRLIDFTRNPSVALYFANTIDNKKECEECKNDYAVWMASIFGDDSTKDDLAFEDLEKAILTLNERNSELADEFLSNPFNCIGQSKFAEMKAIFVENHGIKNARQKAQEGLFLMPFSLLLSNLDVNEKTFGMSFLHLLKGYDGKDCAPRIELCKLLDINAAKYLHKKVKGIKFVFGSETRSYVKEQCIEETMSGRLLLKDPELAIEAAVDVDMSYGTTATRIRSYVKYLKENGAFQSLWF